jgi:hypothetical protein
MPRDKEYWDRYNYYQKYGSWPRSNKSVSKAQQKPKAAETKPAKPPKEDPSENWLDFFRDDTPK